MIFLSIASHKVPVVKMITKLKIDNTKEVVLFFLNSFFVVRVLNKNIIQITVSINKTIQKIMLESFCKKLFTSFKFIHKFIIDAMGFSKEEDCYGVWYHGITQDTKEPSELLAVFDTEVKAQQYVENIKAHKKGYCLIVKSKYYK